MRKIACLASLLALLVSIQVAAQSTSVFDARYFSTENADPPIKVGKGFHINDIYRQTRSCFTPETSEMAKLTSQQTGGKKTSIRLFYTRTNAEYNDFKTRGTSGKVSFLNLFSLGGQKLMEYSNTRIENQERLIFTVNVDFGIYTFNREPSLTTEAKAMISQNKLQDFVSKFGTHYISGVRKESSITVVLTKTSSSDESNTSNTSSFSMGGNVPFKGSGSFEIDRGNWANKQLEDGSYDVSIEIAGPAIEQETLQEQINSILNGSQQDKASAISSIISNAAKNISDPQQSMITQYYYSPFSLYGLEGIHWDEKKQFQLAKINETVIKVYSVKSQLSELITPSGKRQLENKLRSNNVPQYYIDQITGAYNEALPNLRSLNSQADSYLKQLEQKYLECSNVYCKSGSDCCNNENYLSEIYHIDFDEQIQNAVQNILAVASEVKKEMDKPECEKLRQGKITIQNTSVSPYDLYNGDNFVETLPGKTSKTYDVSLGTYRFKAVQKSGYVFYATVNHRTTSLSTPCQEVVLKVGFED